MPAEDSTEVLISRLGDSDPTVRNAALQALHRKRDPAACPAIARLLDDPVKRIRRAAMFLLGEFGCVDAVEKLISLSNSLGDDTDWTVLLLALRRLGVSDDSVVKQALSRDSPMVRAQALRNLAGSPADDAVAILRRNLAEGEPAVIRAAAAASLENFPSDETARVLGQALSDKEPSVRIEAIRSLGHMPAAAAIPALIARRADEQDDRIVSEMIAALVRLDAERFTALLPTGSAAALYDPYGQRAASTTWLRDPLWYPASERMTFFITGTAETADLDDNVVRYRYSAQGSQLMLVELRTGGKHGCEFQVREAELQVKGSAARRTLQVEFSADPAGQAAGPVIYWAPVQHSETASGAR